VDPAALDFRILGPLEIRAGNQELTCRGRKQRLLLGVLLLHANEVVSSDRLIDALWGERSPDTARKALQVHVAGLRQLLEPGRAGGGAGRVLETRAPGYALRVEPRQLDLRRFEDGVRWGRAASETGDLEEAASVLREALALWRGPALADLGFEEGLQAEVAGLEELRLAALEDRIDADLALGRHAELAGELERLTRQHPLRERITAQLMIALYRSGRQADALEAYRSTRRTLVDELGIEPNRELKDLEQRILAQDPKLDVTAAVRGAVAPEAPAPAAPADALVGREPELALASPLIAAALSGRGAAILIGGEPGIGKSRLADALAAGAQDGGARVMVGRCWEAGGAPAYWPWIQALRSYLRATDPESARSHLLRGGPELATILPERAELLADPSVAQTADSGARFRLFEAVASLLISASASQPVAVFLDDLHAADAPSLLLLRFIAGQLSEASVLIVGCYRDTEVGPDLAAALSELSREPTVHRISLGGLGSGETSRLLELTMGSAPGDELAARVHAETQGNPLFAAEVGRLLATESGPDGSGAVIPLPVAVREAIGQRVQRRSERCREVLVLASIIGREFALDLLARVSGLGHEDVLAALDEAADARLVEELPDAPGRLRFSHVLVRDALYAGLAASRRVRLHREVAEGLEIVRAGRLEPHAAELAHHYLQAGTPARDKAVEWARRAGDRAAAQYGYEEAARHYRSALALLDESGSADDRERCRLLLAAGESLSRAGLEAEGNEALLEAARVAEQAGWADLLTQAALRYGGRFMWARASSDPALVPLLERALLALGAHDSPERARLLARLATAIRDDPHRERRLALADEALEIAERSGDPAMLAAVVTGHWEASEGPGDAGAGIQIGARLIALGERIGDRERVFEGHDIRLQGFWKVGDRAGVDVELEAIDALARELRQPAQHWHASTGWSMLALMEGRFEDAERLISETLALGQRAQSWNALVSHRLATFVLRRAQGRLAEIEDTMARSVHDYPALWRFRCALVHLYAELGREQEARAALDGVLAGDLGGEFLDTEWLLGMTLLAEPCAALRDRAAAARLYELLLPYEPHYAQAPVEASFGAAARALGVLATTLGRLDDADRHFEAAIAMERRMRARPWLAHAQHWLAAALLARGGAGDADRAGTLLEEALATYRGLGMDTFAARAAALTGD